MGVDIVLGLEVWNSELQTWVYQPGFEWIGERNLSAFEWLVGDSFRTRRTPPEVINHAPVTFVKHFPKADKEGILWSCGHIEVMDLIDWLKRTTFDQDEDEDDVYGGYEFSTKFTFKRTILWPCTGYLREKAIPLDSARICFGFY